MSLLALLLLLAQDPAPHVAEQIQRLRSDDFNVRAEATRKLTALGNDAVPALKDLLQDADADLRGSATRILAEIERLDRIRRASEPRNRVSVDLKDVSLEDAVRAVCEPFGVKGVVAGFPRPRITLRLDKASFWEAWDAVYEQSGYFAGNAPEQKPGELHFDGPAADHPPVLNATVGDYRILATPMAVTPPSGPVRVGIFLTVVCPVWAEPKRTGITNVSLNDEKIQTSAFEESLPVTKGDPGRTGVIRRTYRWRGENSIVTKAKTVKLAGTLVLTGVPGLDEKNVALPFAIDALPVSPK